MDVKDIFRVLKINIVIFIGGSLIIFLVGEIGLRIYYGNPHTFKYPQVKHIQTSYGYKPKPNQEGSYTLNKLVSINSSGFRDKEEWSSARTKKSTRIMIIGDSFTFGNGINEEDRFSNVLERKLRAQHKNVKVLNASAGGWNLDNEYFFLLEEGLNYNPDFLLIAFFPNDWISPTTNDDSVARPIANLTKGGRWDARPSWLQWLPYSWIYKLKYSALIVYLRDRLAVIGKGPDFVSKLLLNQIDVNKNASIQYSYEILKRIKAICEKNSMSL